MKSQLAGEDHVKDSKGKKDRYAPLADLLIRGPKAYPEAEQPNG